MPRGEQHRIYIGSVSEDTAGHDSFVSKFHETLIREGRVTIPNIGAFRVKRRKRFSAFNNVLGKVVEIGGHGAVVFTPSPKLKESARNAEAELNG